MKTQFLKPAADHSAKEKKRHDLFHKVTDVIKLPNGLKYFTKAHDFTINRRKSITNDVAVRFLKDVNFLPIVVKRN